MKQLKWKPMNVIVPVMMFLCFPLRAKQARVIRLNESVVGRVALTLGRTTVLSFSSKPSKVILGSRGNFGVEYVANDIAIAPLQAKAKSDLFIYLDNRRYAFDLETGSSDGDEIVIVRDLHESSMKVRIQ